MKKVLITILSIAGSWLGWWLGNPFGIWGAFSLSMIGMGLGMYLGRRYIDF